MKLQATFSNGLTISRTTNKQLTHAYLVKTNWNTFKGFAGSLELAQKASSYVPKQGETILFKEIVNTVAN